MVPDKGILVGAWKFFRLMKGGLSAIEGVGTTSYQWYVVGGGIAVGGESFMLWWDLLLHFY